METVPPSSRLDDAALYDCIVISDLHLGSDVCQAKLLEEFLNWAVEHCHELVINGDIFDDLNFKRLTRRHFACLKVIRRNTDRDDIRVVWVRGNHDGPAETISHIVGVDIHDEYVYDNGEIQLLILHGDQFDTFITDYPLAHRDRLRPVLFHPKVDAPPCGSVDSPDHQAVSAQQSFDRASGRGIRRWPWVTVRDLRTHALAFGRRARRRALRE